MRKVIKYKNQNYIDVTDLFHPLSGTKLKAYALGERFDGISCGIKLEEKLLITDYRHCKYYYNVMDYPVGTFPDVETVKINGVMYKCVHINHKLTIDDKSPFEPEYQVGDHIPDFSRNPNYKGKDFEIITPKTSDERTPSHYKGAVTPWDLQLHMKSSGDAFVDGRRTDIIEYVFRHKDDFLGDMKKARHNIDAIIKRLEQKKALDQNETSR